MLKLLLRCENSRTNAKRKHPLSFSSYNTWFYDVDDDNGCMHAYLSITAKTVQLSYLQHFISAQNNIEFLVAGLVIIKSCGDFFPMVWLGWLSSLGSLLWQRLHEKSCLSYTTLQTTMTKLIIVIIISVSHARKKNTLLFFCSYNTHKSVSILFPAVLLPANFFL